MKRVESAEYAPDLSDIRAMIVDWDDLYAFSRGPKNNPGPKIAHHKAVAKLFGYDLTDATLDQYWGTGLHNELPYFYGHPQGVTFEEMLATFESLNDQYPKPLLPGAREIHDSAGRLGLIRGVVTSHRTANARGEITVAGIDPQDFSFIYGSDITSAIKPDPRAFEPAVAVLAEHGIAPDQAIYLGDSLGDGSAIEAGMQFIGVATGRVAVEGFLQAGFHAEENLHEVGRLLLARTTFVAESIGVSASPQ